MTDPAELTDIERQVLEAWCYGLSNVEIAQTLHRKVNSVKNIGRRVTLKLQATCPRHATAIWTRRNAEIRPE